MSRLSRQCGILNILQPYRPPRPVTGIALLLLYRNKQKDGDKYIMKYFINCIVCRYCKGNSFKPDIIGRKFRTRRMSMKSVTFLSEDFPERSHLGQVRVDHGDIFKCMLQKHGLDKAITFWWLREHPEDELL
jgi:hypothetical protein